MTSRNDITGDSLSSKMNNDNYREGWDKIFKKDRTMNTPIDVTDEVVSKLKEKSVNVRRVHSPVYYENGFNYEMVARKSQLADEYREIYSPSELAGPITEELMKYCSIAPEWEASRNPTIYVYKVEICTWGISIKFSASNFGKPVEDKE